MKNIFFSFVRHNSVIVLILFTRKNIFHDVDFECFSCYGCDRKHVSFFVPHLKEGEDAKMSNRSILSLFVTLALALSLMCVLPAAAEGRYTPGTYVGEADGFRW